MILRTKKHNEYMLIKENAKDIKNWQSVRIYQDNKTKTIQ